jgi:predicted nucleic acid-binding protein
MLIPSCLVDTNILLRLARSTDPQHQIVKVTVGRLADEGAVLHYTHQNIAELWNVMTRPRDRNGLGLAAAKADREVRSIEKGMKLLLDNEAVYREWRRLIVEHSILGVQVYDARLAACMYVHGIKHILTLNVADFGRFTGLTALHPSSL